MDGAPLGGLSLAEVRRAAVERLSAIYPPDEARAFTRRLLSYFVPEWEMHWLASCGQAPFPAQLLPAWEAALSDALHGRPLAYILGQTDFLGHRIRIRPGIFIPRPETEEWIAWLIQHLRDRPPESILEVGSGSGALLIALGKAFPQTTLFALDQNPLAIALTSENAQSYGLEIFTETHDFLQTPLPSDWQGYQWDLIISNPPYIPLSDKETVAPSVLTYEPHEALFCQDMEFYEKLGQIAIDKLSQGGMLVVELYPPTAFRVRDYFYGMGFEVTMHRDLAGRWRWASATVREKCITLGTFSGSSSAR